MSPRRYAVVRIFVSLAVGLAVPGIAIVTAWRGGRRAMRLRLAHPEMFSGYGYALPRIFLGHSRVRIPMLRGLRL